MQDLSLDPAKLDRVDFVESLDRQGMLAAVEMLPQQCEEAISLAQETPLDFGGSDFSINSIIVLGMGGSGIGGDIAHCVLQPELKVPFSVNKGYNLPNYVSEKSLCFVVSYSGNTEETLSCFEQAVSREAKVVIITAGGELGRKAKEKGLSVVEVPQGLQPRAALGYLTLPILVILSMLGLISDQTESLKETVEVLKKQALQWGAKIPLEKNEAKRTASLLYHKVPVIYGGEGLTGVAALRWKCQFNENSKSPAFCNSFPELEHNEIEGWEHLKDITKNFSLLLLRHREEEERMSRRIDLTRSLIENHFGNIFEFWSQGQSRLAKIFSLIYLGDFVSVYLALLNKEDPSPMEKIEFLKSKLIKYTKGSDPLIPG